MAFRTWGRLLLTALGVSMLAGAGQLGIAFGLGIVRLDGDFTGGSINQWPAQLVWAGWFAANAAVAGAVLTERLARRDGLLTGTMRPVAIAAAAALGATVVVPLCMQPARAAELISMDPVWTVAICATAGAVMGAGAAAAVLLRPPVGWNMALLTGAGWVLALVSAAPGLLRDGPLATVRLGVFEPSWLDPDAAQRLSMLVLPLVALLAGAVTGGLSRHRGHPPLVSGATGTAGPVLLAFAYLTAGPGDAIDRYQATPYYGALLAVAVGALGSAAAALLRWPLMGETPGGHARGTAPAPSTAIEPTEVLRALPAGPALPSTRTAHAATTDRSAADTPATDSTPTTPATAGMSNLVHWEWPEATTVSPANGPTETTDTPATAKTAATTATVTGNTGNPAGTATAGAASIAPVPETAAAHDAAAGAAVPETAAAAGAAVPETAAAADAGAAPRSATTSRPMARPKPATNPMPAAPKSVTRPKPTATAKSTAAASTATTPGPTATPRPTATPKPVTRPTSTAAAKSATGLDEAGLDAGPRSDATPESAPTVPTPAAPPVAPPPPAAPPAPATGPQPPTTPATVLSSAPAPVAGPDRPTLGDGTPESAPRPRHRAPLPDLDRAANWDALATARRAGPPPAPEAPESGPTTDAAATARGETVPDTEDAPPTGRARGRRGLFRRHKARTEQDAAAATDPASGRLPAPDEEFVDWVSGLSKPLPDNEPEQESGRRSLRSSGRHHQRD